MISSAVFDCVLRQISEAMEVDGVNNVGVGNLTLCLLVTSWTIVLFLNEADRCQQSRLSFHTGRKTQQAALMLYRKKQLSDRRCIYSC
jgi:hypothetical protein